jgi:opacity protein-like surface antigen
LWAVVALAALVLPAGAWAQAESAGGEEPFAGFYGLGAAVGIAHPKDLSSTVGFLVRLDLGAPILGFSVLPTVEYWGKGDRAGGTKISAHDLTTGAELRYRFGHATSRPYAGAGLAMHFVSTEVKVGDVVQSSEQHQRLGAVLLGGVEFKRSRAFSFFAEGDYHFVKHLNTWKAMGGILVSP